MTHRSGSVALVGRPNVGKSTLINKLVGQKVSIVSDKAQTTRRRALGVLTTEEYQIAFFDTPGFHESATQFGKILNEAAQSVLTEVDLLLVVVDSSRLPSKDDEAIATQVKRATQAVGEFAPKRMLCLNKMDLLRAQDVADHTEAFTKLFNTEDWMMTCVTKGHNVDKLMEMIVERMPEGEAMYPEDEYTDQPMRFLAAEIVREKALRLTRAEVPHAIATIVDQWEDEESGMTRIMCSIVVEKDGQKAIIIGKGGSMLKEIGTAARIELEEMLGGKVFLNVQVKVRSEWRQNPRMLRDLEYFNG